MSANGALVRLEDLKVWFPIKSGIVLDRHIGDIKAVDGVTIDIHRGETLGLVGRVGVREVHGRPGDPAAVQADVRPDRVRREGHHQPRRR